VRLLILQHPMEVDHAKGSARLLQLSVAGATMVTGETFDPVELQRLLEQEGRVPLLLYPELPGERALGIAAPPAIDPAALAQPSRLLLVVLDGTWRKSRKMLYLNPLLQTLPRLGLAQMAPSHYRIRKAHAADQLSTLEATCHALGQLEGAPQRYQSLLNSFDAFVARFQATGGRLAP
jgi:DTW domain-containing protein YfiP